MEIKIPPDLFLDPELVLDPEGKCLEIRLQSSGITVQVSLQKTLKFGKRFLIEDYVINFTDGTTPHPETCFDRFGWDAQPDAQDTLRQRSEHG